MEPVLILLAGAVGGALFGCLLIALSGLRDLQRSAQKLSEMT
jgi:hypothetical protein